MKKQVSGGAATWYLGDHYEIRDGEVTKFIFAADRRVAKITSEGGIEYFSKDHLGSSTVVTDEFGGLVESSDYRPFGEERFYSGAAAKPSTYKYTDQELDREPGLYNYNARHYDPIIGRFISPDSLIPNLFDPQQLNPYAYCRNNPLIYVDPTGHLGTVENTARSEPEGFFSDIGGSGSIPQFGGNGMHGLLAAAPGAKVAIPKTPPSLKFARFVMFWSSVNWTDSIFV